MAESNELESFNVKKLEAETRKLEAEARKLESETAAARSAQWRAWIVSLSVVVGIGVSAIGVYNTLSEIAFKNRQLGLESQVQSNEMFLNQVLDRMSGIKVVHSEVDNTTGQLVLKSRDNYGDVIQVGAYGAAVSLACLFDNLRLAAQTALTFQLAVQPKDIAARDMLRRIDDGCPSGWDRLTEVERSEWFRHASQ
jgi:hypothetical protein